MEEEKEEATTNLYITAAATIISMDTVAVAVLSDLNNIFRSKEKQRISPKASLVRKDVFALLPTCRYCSSGGLELFLTGSTGNKDSGWPILNATD